MATFLWNQPQKGVDLWWTLRFIFVFALVALLAVAVTRLWARNKIRFTGHSAGHIRLLEFLPLHQNKGLCLVRVVDKVLLLSVTETAISVLEELPLTPELEELPLGDTVPAPLDWIKARLSKYKKSPQLDQGAATGGQDFAKELRERLQRLQEPKL